MMYYYVLKLKVMKSWSRKGKIFPDRTCRRVSKCLSGKIGRA